VSRVAPDSRVGSTPCAATPGLPQAYGGGAVALLPDGTASPADAIGARCRGRTWSPAPRRWRLPVAAPCEAGQAPDLPQQGARTAVRSPATRSIVLHSPLADVTPQLPSRRRCGQAGPDRAELSGTFAATPRYTPRSIHERRRVACGHVQHFLHHWRDRRGSGRVVFARPRLTFRHRS
jgi:hypothetical protein